MTARVPLQNEATVRLGPGSYSRLAAWACHLALVYYVLLKEYSVYQLMMLLPHSILLNGANNLTFRIDKQNKMTIFLVFLHEGGNKSTHTNVSANAHANSDDVEFL